MFEGFRGAPLAINSIGYNPFHLWEVSPGGERCFDGPFLPCHLIISLNFFYICMRFKKLQQWWVSVRSGPLWWWFFHVLPFLPSSSLSSSFNLPSPVLPFPHPSVTIYSVSPSSADASLPQVPYSIPNLCDNTDCSIQLEV